MLVACLLVLAVCAAAVALHPAPLRPLPRFLQLAMVARVPVLVVVGYVLVPVVATARRNELIGNLFALEGAVDVGLVVLWGVALAWVALVCVDVALVRAPDRMRLDRASSATRAQQAYGAERLPRRVRTRGGLALLLSAPLLVALLRADGASTRVVLLGALVGCAVLAVLVVAIDRVWRLLLRWRALRDPERWPRWIRPAPDGLPGYRNERGEIGGEHLLTTAYLVVFGAVYVVGRSLLHPAYGVPTLLPTLGYVWALGVLLCTLGAGATFFLDRFRVPLLVAVVLYGIVISRFPGNAHVYEHAPAGVERASARDALRARLAAGELDDTIVVVAAAGGGITASAWTARVLAGLEAELAGRPGPDFRNSLALVSGVSGGSVGLLHALAAPRDAADAHAVYGAGLTSVRLAGRSVLPAVGWGLAYPDLMRALRPRFFVNPIDRGWALERAWARGLAGADGEEPTWDGWVAATARGELPAVVFNGTALESGRQVQFSTVDLGWSEGDGVGAADLGPVHPVVAARLSSTFPYVTPAARLHRDGGSQPGDVHVLDGGYFDNSGFVSALAWIDRCFPAELEADDPLRRVERILLLQVDGFPFDAEEAEPTGSWAAAVLGPLLGAVNVRVGSQRARNELAVRRMDVVLRQRGGPSLHRIELRSNLDAPLSWHLTRGERARLDEAWLQELAEFRDAWRRLTEPERAPALVDDVELERVLGGKVEPAWASALQVQQAYTERKATKGDG